MLNDALMIGIVLTIVFGAVIFYLYNRLSLAERKMGLVEGVLTDMKVMLDAAPLTSEPPPRAMYEKQAPMNEFEPMPEMFSGISGPMPMEKDDVEDVATDDYQQTLEQALDSALAIEKKESNYRTLQIDEPVIQGTPLPSLQPVQVTKLLPDLDGMTVKELQAHAKEKGITIPAGTRRKDIIDLIRKTVEGGSTAAPTSTLAPANLDGPEPPAVGASLDVAN